MHTKCLLMVEWLKIYSLYRLRRTADTTSIMSSLRANWWLTEFSKYRLPIRGFITLGGEGCPDIVAVWLRCSKFTQLKNDSWWYYSVSWCLAIVNLFDIYWSMIASNNGTPPLLINRSINFSSSICITSWHWNAFTIFGTLCGVSTGHRWASLATDQ